MNSSKILKFLVLFFYCFGFSQNEKQIHGSIFCEGNAVQKIDVINLVSEKSTVSDLNGNFYISTKEKDILVFYSKNYEYKQIIIKKSDIESNNIKIVLVKKPEELDEVVIFNRKIVQTSENTQKYVDKPYFDDLQSSPINQNVYSGKTPGVNFFAIIGLISDLIKGKDSKKAEIKPALDFEKVVENPQYKIFFEKNLLLKKAEIALFLEFCSKDEKVNLLLKPNKVLELMDFFIVKNKEFKALLTLKKE